MIKLALSPLGVIALRDDELLASRLFKGDPASIASKFSKASSGELVDEVKDCLLYTSPSPRDRG